MPNWLFPDQNILKAVEGDLNNWVLYRGFSSLQWDNERGKFLHGACVFLRESQTGLVSSVNSVFAVVLRAWCSAFLQGKWALKQRRVARLRSGFLKVYNHGLATEDSNLMLYISHIAHVGNNQPPSIQWERKYGSQQKKYTSKIITHVKTALCLRATSRPEVSSRCSLCKLCW